MAKITIDGVTYYEREDNSKEGFGIRPAKGQNRPMLIITHGIGERGAGLLANLINLTDGFDYDGEGPLPRQYAFENETIEAFAAKYDIHLVTVNYPETFEPNDYTYVIGVVIAEYSVDKTRIYIDGFSLGGGAVLKYVTSSVANAALLAGAFACAPVNWATTHKNVADARLQVVGTTCEVDKTVSPGNIKDFVAKVNAFNPEFPVYLIIYPGEAHSGFNEFLAEENTWKWMIANSTAKRIPFTRPTGTTPVPVPDPVPTTLKAVPNYTLTGSTLVLDGSKSTGQNYGFWGFTAVPDGVNIWGLNLGGNIKSQITLPKQGTYKLKLTVSNAAKQTDAEEITVVYGTAPVPPRVLVEATGSIVLKYSDGSTGLANARVVDGKIVVE